MDPHVATLIEPFVEAARSYVRRALKLELDSSPESLAYVDHYVRSVRDDKEGLEPDVLRLTASALGAYFGEVVIAAFGGGWVIDAGTEVAPERWHIELDPPSVSFLPVGMAAYALAGSKASDLAYDDHVTPPLRDAAALAQLLEGRAPVDTDYFYSLTGRYEMLEQMRELLAEIDRRRQAGPPRDEPGEDDEDDEKKILN